MKKLENIKVIFVDIDGTLINDNKQISEITRQTIEKTTKNGIYVVLSSGRANASVCTYSKISKASNYVISSNGAQIYDYDKNISIFENKIENIIIEKIWNYLLDKKLECFLNGEDVRYCNKYLKDLNDPLKIIIDDLDIIKDKSIFQIVVYSKNYCDLEDVENWIKNMDDLKVTNSSQNYVNKVVDGREYFINIAYDNVNKGNAINYFLEFIGAKKEESICFGDHFNDNEMFEVCGYKVAMENASDELKLKADYITLSNNEDGVAHFIENCIDIKK